MTSRIGISGDHDPYHSAKHQQVKCGVDLQTAPDVKATGANRVVFGELPEEQSRNKKATQHKEQINPHPAGTFSNADK